MSEYQYYEFQAIDRPLTEKEMGELRSYSTRARITPTSLVNDYSWDNFKGEEDAWMERYFDAFLYLANWGTHVLKLRLPTRLLDAKIASSYCAGERASVREKSGKVILTFASEDEEGGDWVDGDGHLSSLISVRAELGRGDLRALYLGWLLCAQSGDLDDNDLEPPVPAGLAQLSALLESHAAFLRVDPDLICVAANASPALAHAEPKPEDVRASLAKLPAREKDDLLARMIAGDGTLASELAQRMRRERDGDRAGMALEDEPSQSFCGKPSTLRTRGAVSGSRRQPRRRPGANARPRPRGSSISTGWQGRSPPSGGGWTSWSPPSNPSVTTRRWLSSPISETLAARNDGSDFRRRLEALRTEHARKPTLVERLQKVA
jgi:hypothetical protein